MITCTTVIPALYKEINEIHEVVLAGLAAFRTETDSAWIEIMDVQLMISPELKRPENFFDSIFRRKRQQLPPWNAWNASPPGNDDMTVYQPI
ncbi:unnamed protein product [Cylicocyclus nassatus]|uniref:Nematode cuticle collagen N-terminal domain-containing protein n=1 Tax=Cylicocyclus nassatus TaxID=53992 RepID=A0AA36GPG4_CYLNA|nr:unnamed protein product [Cylicocyclus nassatus]